MRWVTRIEADHDGARLTQRLEYEVKFGPLGWILDRVAMRRNVTRNVGVALRRLVETAESGA